MKESANNTMNAEFNLQLFAEGDPAPSADPAPADQTSPPAASTDPAAPPAAVDPAAAPPATDRNPDGTFKATQADQAPVGAPETYTAFTVPEGMAYDQGAADQFAVIAKENNLTQKQAQALVSHYAGINKANTEAWAATVNGWATESETVHGAKGIEAAKAALDRFPESKDPEFMKFLADSGLSSNKHFISIFKTISEKISPHVFADSIGHTGGFKAGDKSPGRYYASMKDLKST